MAHGSGTEVLTHPDVIRIRNFLHNCRGGGIVPGCFTVLMQFGQDSPVEPVNARCLPPIFPVDQFREIERPLRHTRRLLGKFRELLHVFLTETAVVNLQCQLRLEVNVHDTGQVLVGPVSIKGLLHAHGQRIILVLHNGFGA